jgi:hypothetical protein
MNAIAQVATSLAAPPVNFEVPLGYSKEFYWDPNGDKSERAFVDALMRVLGSFYSIQFCVRQFMDDYIEVEIFRKLDRRLRQDLEDGGRINNRFAGNAASTHRMSSAQYISFRGWRDQESESLQMFGLTIAQQIDTD